MSLFNFFGTTVKHTTDFWGNKKTIVHNRSTGVKKEYTRKRSLFGDYTDVRIKHSNGYESRGRARTNFWGERVYEGECFACNGTGRHRSGNTCRKCGGSGVYRRTSR